ncbi:MAG: DUF111 family protein [Actinobacteria bacterium]|nr:DUF111 family protein [Actinomycetota bacterium]
MEEKGCLYLLKFDHLSGEEVGCLVEMLYDRGAHDVQVLPSMTKKSRPGCIVLVDADMPAENMLALARQFGISGFHRVETVHLFEQASYQTLPLTLRYKGRSLDVEMRVKVIDAPSALTPVRPEYDDLVDLCKRIRDTLGVETGLPRLRRLIESRLEAGEPFVVDLD